MMICTRSVLWRNLFVIWITLLSFPGNCSAVLERVSLADDKEAVCSNGSPAAYYRSLSRNDHGRNFVIFLEGGGYCHDVNACSWRCNMAPHLCTTPTGLTVENTGILSDSPKDNPHFHHFFKVDLPYCTSDMYIGRRPASVETKGQHFRGRRVFTAMVKSLIADAGLDSARRIVLTGSSAGGAGVAFNCDFLKKFLPRAEVHCVVDAALFYPVGQPLRVDGPCESIDKVLRVGGELWNSPEALNLELRGWWKYIQQPLFIGIARFDQFGIESFCGEENSTSDLDVWGSGIQTMSRDLVRQFPDVGLFIPGCISHMMLTNPKTFHGLPVSTNHVTYSDTLWNWITRSGQIHAVDKCWDSPGSCRQYC